MYVGFAHMGHAVEALCTQRCPIEITDYGTYGLCSQVILQNERLPREVANLSEVQLRESHRTGHFISKASAHALYSDPLYNVNRALNV